MLIFKALGVNSLTAFKWTARDSSYFNIEPFAGVANAEAAYPIQSTIFVNIAPTFTENE